MRITSHQIALRGGMPVTLRTPEAADAERVLAHRIAIAKQSGANMDSGPDVLAKITAEDQARQLSEVAEHPKSVFVIGTIGDQVVGVASVIQRSGAWSAHVGDLGMGVLEQYRSKGLGRALMNSALEASERAGIWNVILSVRTFNAPAIDLYESVGFHRIGHLKSVALLPDRMADEYIYQRLRRRASGSFAI